MLENSALLEMSAIMTLLKILLAQEPIISTWLCRFYLKVKANHIMQGWEYKKQTRLKSNHSDVSFSFNNTKAVIKAVRVQFSSNKHDAHENKHNQ